MPPKVQVDSHHHVFIDRRFQRFIEAVIDLGILAGYRHGNMTPRSNGRTGVKEQTFDQTGLEVKVHAMSQRGQQDFYLRLRHLQDYFVLHDFLASYSLR